MDEWEASEADNLDQRFSRFPHLSKAHCGCYSFHRSSPCQLQQCCSERDTCRHIPSAVLFLLIFCCFALEKSTRYFPVPLFAHDSAKCCRSLWCDHSPRWWRLSRMQQLLNKGPYRSNACRRRQKTGKAPGLKGFLGSRFENHCAQVVAADTAERVAKSWLMPPNAEAGSCHQPLAAAVTTRSREGQDTCST